MTVENGSFTIITEVNEKTHVKKVFVGKVRNQGGKAAKGCVGGLCAGTGAGFLVGGPVGALFGAVLGSGAGASAGAIAEESGKDYIEVEEKYYVVDLANGEYIYTHNNQYQKGQCVYFDKENRSISIVDEL